MSSPDASSCKTKREEDEGLLSYDDDSISGMDPATQQALALTEIDDCQKKLNELSEKASKELIQVDSKSLKMSSPDASPCKAKVTEEEAAAGSDDDSISGMDAATQQAPTDIDGCEKELDELNEKADDEIIQVENKSSKMSSSEAPDMEDSDEKSMEKDGMRMIDEKDDQRRFEDNDGIDNGEDGEEEEDDGESGRKRKKEEEDGVSGRKKGKVMGKGEEEDQ